MDKRLKNSVIATICILRISVGGHLFFAGMIKLINPGWSSLPFLENARIPFLRLIANNEVFIQVIDSLNVLGLGLTSAYSASIFKLDSAEVSTIGNASKILLKKLGLK